MGIRFKHFLDYLKPKRRWIQFSLGTLFVLMTALCVVLGTWIVPAEQQRQAVLALAAGGAHLSYAEARETDNAVVSFLRRWLPEDYFDEVEMADFTFCGDAGFRRTTPCLCCNGDGGGLDCRWRKDASLPRQSGGRNGEAVAGPPVGNCGNDYRNSGWRASAQANSRADLPSISFGIGAGLWSVHAAANRSIDVAA